MADNLEAASGVLAIPAEDVPLVRPPPVSERYFATHMFATDIKGKPCEDQYVYQHSNRLCMVGLGPFHPLRSKQPTKVSFDVSETLSRLSNRPKGKAKRNTQWLTEFSPLCIVRCADGTEYILYSCMRGMLFEVNERLLTHPHLLSEKPDSEGYIAFVNPKKQESETCLSHLLSREQYTAHVQARAAAANTAAPLPAEPSSAPPLGTTSTE